ncbi:hypothetical protein HOP50_10g58820 [Chloropicon primus]|uniref:Uncharacterized protein n=1 Tax=Chloropicon primus TaxID=1764295 RepID=A0A5B8MUB9_9CHLO|nr:hypothetical protein A3770_10p58620 [Chloropicon primus]UPR02556.1 hypothetical protein HOP50_10g58820 [Chloropicon primus]|mmetsp:Transcript_3348/g.9357  ORF Transcript_3348/g.9357 Transcript_3348/m.9357 type:complete len:174 (+) Transcript_3348:5559-6080(+)|eukprot:QDZ23344.1 hypothetical protein A3770_10p58620 [Chloropicon primus]
MRREEGVEEEVGASERGEKGSQDGREGCDDEVNRSGSRRKQQRRRDFSKLEDFYYPSPEVARLLEGRGGTGEVDKGLRGILGRVEAEDVATSEGEEEEASGEEVVDIRPPRFAKYDRPVDLVEGVLRGTETMVCVGELDTVGGIQKLGKQAEGAAPAGPATQEQRRGPGEQGE